MLQNDCSWRSGLERFSLVYGTLHSVSSWSKHYLRTIRRGKLAPFDAHRFRHRENELVAFNCRNQRQPNTCVAARRLNDCGARLQSPILLGRLDHRQSNTILYAAAGIEVLHLRQNTGTSLIEPVGDFNKRRGSNLLQNILYHIHALRFSLLPLLAQTICENTCN